MMNIQKIPALGKTLFSLAVAGFLLFSGCQNSQNKKLAAPEKPPLPEKAVRAPSMEIHAAALLGNIRAIREHIGYGSNLDEKDPYGSTPLLIAATFGRTGIAIALIEAGADPDITNRDGSTALHTAAFMCRKEIVRELLVHGADKTVKNNFGSTALQSIEESFSEVKAIYDQLSRDLGPLGLKLDYDYIRRTRPEIADMLR